MTKSRWVPAKPERYAEGAERELAQLDVLEKAIREDPDPPILEVVATVAAAAQTKALLAGAAATTQLAEVLQHELREIDKSLMMIVELIRSHPVIQHALATREAIGSQSAKINELETALGAVGPTPVKEDTDGKLN